MASRNSKEGQLKKEMQRLADALRKKGTPTTPFPTELTKPEHFLKLNVTNVLGFDGAAAIAGPPEIV